MKGIILAGGAGSRMGLSTKVTNKHLLCVYDRPMIFFPLWTLRNMGVKEILIISGKEHVGDMIGLLGSGSDFGVDFTYRVQEGVGGLSSVNTYFYVMDKPVMHIGACPFKKKRSLGRGYLALSDRAGYIVEDFQDLLDKTEDSVMNPSKFSVERKRTVDKYIDYLGEDSRKAILSEFRRFFVDEAPRR